MAKELVTREDLAKNDGTGSYSFTREQVIYLPSAVLNEFEETLNHLVETNPEYEFWSTEDLARGIWTISWNPRTLKKPTMTKQHFLKGDADATEQPRTDG